MAWLEAHSSGTPISATINVKRIRWGKNQPHVRSAKVLISFKLLDHDETMREIIVEAKDLMKAGISPN
jgi:hypothetical protein